MRHFLLNIFLGLLGLMGLSMGIFVLRAYLDAPNIRHAYRIPNNVNFLFIGDSHIGCSIIPNDHIKLLWNNASAPVFSQIRLLELERRGALRAGLYCVTEIGYQTLYAEYRTDSVQNALVHMAPIVWRYPYLFPSTTFSNALLTYLLKGGSQACDVPPPDTMPFSARSIAFKKEALSDTWEKHFDFDEAVRARAVAWHMAALTQIVTVCKRNGMMPVVFSAPVHPLYLSEVPQYAKDDLERVKRLLQQLGVIYFDFMADRSEWAFRDEHHLLRKEAQIFTQDLIHNIRNAKGQSGH